MNGICLTTSHKGLIGLMLDKYPVACRGETEEGTRPLKYVFHGLNREQLKKFLEENGYNLPDIYIIFDFREP